MKTLEEVGFISEVELVALMTINVSDYPKGYLTSDELTEIYIEAKKKGFIEEEFNRFARKNNDRYMMYFSGRANSWIFKAFNKLLGYRLQTVLAERYRKRVGTAILNYIECEAHRELVIEGLKK